MIKTVTVNPALDKTIILDELEIGKVNRVKQVHKDAGGKGINVSKMIHNLEGESIATGILGGETGLYIKAELDRMGIENNFIESDGETRTNLKLVCLKDKSYTDINENGAFLSSARLAELEQVIFNKMQENDLLVLSGSLPAGIDDTIYAEWTKKAKLKGIKVILDADGPLLENAVKAGPMLIKPNRHELAVYTGKELITGDDIVKAAEGLFKFGIKMIMVSLGAAGAIFLTGSARLMIEPLSLTVKSTVGAGDAMVAGLVLGIERKLPVEEMVTLAAAASSASLLNDGTEMGSKEEVFALKKQIKYYYL